MQYMDADGAVMAAIRQGDDQAFRLLVERHARALLRLAHRVTGNAYDAEDVVQETFLRAYRELERFEERANHPDALADEELKLLAIQGLQHTDPERAFPLLERVLKSDQSARLKSRALFVLAQSDAPAARQILGNIARDSSPPDLQRRAVEYLGVHGGRANRELLGEIYASSENREVKRRVLRAFMVAGERQQLLDAAMSEPDPELRKEAIRQLGPMGAQDELWQLYQKETSPDLKKQTRSAHGLDGLPY